MKQGGIAEFEKVRHRIVDVEVLHEAAEDHVARVAPREDEAGVGENPMNERSADQVQRELVDDEPAGLCRNPLVELGKIEPTQAADLPDTKRREPVEIAQRRLYSHQQRHFSKAMVGRVATGGGMSR